MSGPGRNVGRRRKARELLVQALYASRVGAGPVVDAIEEQIERRQPSAGSAAYARELAPVLAERRAAYDGRIDALVENRAADRIGVVERCVLQLALCELERGEVPEGAVISEAVELAQNYSTDDAGRFVNGLLSKLAAAARDGANDQAN